MPIQVSFRTLFPEAAVNKHPHHIFTLPHQNYYSYWLVDSICKRKYHFRLVLAASIVMICGCSGVSLKTKELLQFKVILSFYVTNLLGIIKLCLLFKNMELFWRVSADTKTWISQPKIDLQTLLRYLWIAFF